MVWWCWVNFQCRSVLHIWIIVGQGPTALAVGAGGCCLDIFFSRLSSLSPSLADDPIYTEILKGPLNPKQPTKIQTTVQIILYGGRKNHTLVSIWYQSCQSRLLFSFFFYARHRRRGGGLPNNLRRGQHTLWPPQ